MLTLILLRHAKSDWGDATTSDFDRPLSKRGVEAAPRMGAYMARSGAMPELILCSAAVRTRETLALLLPELKPPPPRIEYEDELYLAPATAMLRRLRALPPGPRRVMVIGHNPGMQALALDLTGTGKREEISAITSKFPTCGLAVLTFPVKRWADVGPAAGTLVDFMAPRRLA